MCKDNKQRKSQETDGLTGHVDNNDDKECTQSNKEVEEEEELMKQVLFCIYSDGLMSLTEEISGDHAIWNNNHINNIIDHSKPSHLIL